MVPSSLGETRVPSNLGGAFTIPNIDAIYVHIAQVYETVWQVSIFFQLFNFMQSNSSN